MLEFLFGIFILLHGLVHLWYVVLSQRWVEFRPEMGWTGVSWLLSPLLGNVATCWMSTDGTPIVDLKAYIPVCDRVQSVKVPEWIAHWPEWMPEGGMGLAEGEKE